VRWSRRDSRITPQRSTTMFGDYIAQTAGTFLKARDDGSGLR